LTGRERVLAALQREPTDRVPVLEMAVDWKVIRGLGFGGYLEMAEKLDLDGVSVNQMLYLMGWRRFVLPLVQHYNDQWGVRSRLAGELLPVPVDHPVSSFSDLKRLKPPDPAADPLLKAIRYVRRRLPDKAVIVLSRNDFAASWFLCGMERLLISYIEDPDFADAAAGMVHDYYSRFFRLAVDAGADIVFLTDDYAYKTGTLMGRERFIRYVLPWLKAGVDAVHDAGGLCVKHTDGDISDIIDLIVDTGIDGLGPLEPAAGNDLAKVQRRWGECLTVVGNIDVDFLSRAAPREVTAQTRSLVERLSCGGSHILSSGNTITSSVLPENFRAMVEAVTAPPPPDGR
jgi:uroporphyrinogen decarboxylase